MSHANEQSAVPNSLVKPRLNVLVLDGGGVRGLSSLLILQRLMEMINSHVPSHVTGYPLNPHDVFGLAAGTSTGGLIALMLGKMNMTPEGCITQYKKLSKVVFGTASWRGRLTKGFLRDRYYGDKICECVQQLLRENSLSPTLSMVSPGDRMFCAVVCRENLESSDLSSYAENPVAICNRDCGGILCQVHQAAQATSAALTYFPIVTIYDAQQNKNRYFADGGFQYNNPSRFIYNHYGEQARVDAAGPAQQTAAARHEGLDHTDVRYVNIGTGKYTTELARRRDRIAGAWPNALKIHMIRKIVHAISIMKKAATDANRTAESMETIAQIHNSPLKYERFSADTGVCFIKLDKHRKLGEVEELTLTYLNREDVRNDMERVAGEIAVEYLAKREYVEREVEERRTNDRLGQPQGNTAGLMPPPQAPNMHSSSANSFANSNVGTSDDRRNAEFSPTPSTSSSLRGDDSQATNSALDPSAVRQDHES